MMGRQNSFTFWTIFWFLILDNTASFTSHLRPRTSTSTRFETELAFITTPAETESGINTWIGKEINKQGDCDNNDIVGEKIINAFASAKSREEAAFMTFITAGYPSADDTPSILMAKQEGGAAVIEMGVPYSDPAADGPTIQYTNQVAIENGTTEISQCLDMVKKAREMGLIVPVLLMGYYNPIYQYGVDKLCKDTREAGADGYIVVDLPPEEGNALNAACVENKLSNIPLVTPTTTDQRIAALANMASTFLYCVSLAGVTGERDSLPDDLGDFIQRVRSKTELPLAVGFGISNPDMVHSVANIADGFVVGSAIIKAMNELGDDATTEERSEAVRDIIIHLNSGSTQNVDAKNQARKLGKTPSKWSDIAKSDKTKLTRFGKYGGRYIPETLSSAFEEMEKGYNIIKNDPDFQAELDEYRTNFIGGPTPLQRADGLSAIAGGATIWLKREDLVHTGTHKINNAIGQAILAKRGGKRRIVAESAAGGQHGIATATACAKLGLDCTVCMGALDYEQQKLNVFQMQKLGATVVPVESGERKLKDAINEAMRDWVSNVHDTHYLIGSAIGPHPAPTIVRDFQSVIGREIRSQMINETGKLPDAIVACVGGGSNAIGAFHPFLNDTDVELFGVEAARICVDDGDNDDERSQSILTKGTPGVFHGALTYMMQDKAGQTAKTNSIAAGMDYPAVGPELAYLKDIGRIKSGVATNDEAMEGFNMMCKHEGIIPALETSHAVYYAMKVAKDLGPGKDVVINVNGSGDKDMLQLVSDDAK